MTTMTFELARALDRLRPEDGRAFLAKLALSLAHRLGDDVIFCECVKTALLDPEADD